MSDEQRDFFISFTNADLSFAEAINAALCSAQFTTFYYPRDLGPGGNIAMWMDSALQHSAQTLALYSPDYAHDRAVYSKAERYASWWQDPAGDKRKLVPVLLRDTNFSPLIAAISYIDARGLTPTQAGALVVDRLKMPNETEFRRVWRQGLPLPKIFSAPYRANPNFVGRLEALERLHLSFRSQARAMVTAITGMAGIGKTTLASEYCHQFGGLYGGVWWVRAEHKSAMISDLQALGVRLGNRANDNVETDARLALDHLASSTVPWLVVYENAQDLDSIRNWLPKGSARCLITSRFTEFESLANRTHLEAWPTEVTSEYLLTRTQRSDLAGATRLAVNLEGLPLAAEQAGSYLRPRSGVSFDDYSAEIARLMKRPKPDGAKGEYPDTVYGAFANSLETLRKVDSIALGIVSLCAFLSPDGVDLSLLTVKWSHQILRASFAAALTDRSAREDAVAALASLSLVRREDGPWGQVLVFHRLLLAVVRDWMGEDERVLWGGAAAQLVSLSIPIGAPSDPSRWSSTARLLSHLHSLDTHAPRTATMEREVRILLNRAYVYSYARGDRENALAMAERCVALTRRTCMEDPLELATDLNGLGVCYLNLGRVEKAEAAFREALDIEQPRLGANNPDLGLTLGNLAEIYWARKEFAKAEPLLLQAVEIDKAVYGEDSARYAVSLDNLGSFYSESGQATKNRERSTIAKAHHETALTITIRSCGIRHPQTAQVYKNIAAQSWSQNRRSTAINACQRAVAIMLSLGLSDSHLTMDYARFLAFMWQETRQRKKSARLVRGDISDLLARVIEIEQEHLSWVAENPAIREFGPPSAFAKN